MLKHLSHHHKALNGLTMCQCATKKLLPHPRAIQSPQSMAKG